MSDSRDDLPSRVFDAAQAGALDRRFVASFGVAGFSLMQRAGQAAFSALARRWPTPGALCVLCGSGHNGGDGFLLAREALAAGWRVRVSCLRDPAELQGDAARAAGAYREADGEIAAFADAPISADVVADALLGTGLNRDVAGSYARAIARVNAAAAAGAGVLAVDMPSGVDADTGRVWGQAVCADVTVTFIGLKLGLLTGAGPGQTGELVFAALGAPAALYDGQAHAARRLNEADRARALAPRGAATHKGDYGHVLCVGGNVGTGGAIRMSAEAALRAGAGLVSVACHRDHAAAMSQARPELMCRPAAADESIADLIEAADVIAIGPGLGGDAWAEALWAEVIAADKPLVVDADALNRLAKKPRARGNWVLTPHPGEAARLLGCATAEIGHDRPGAARRIARRYHGAVVLKGAGSLIAGPDGALRVCAAGNPGMAVGGMGDALTGVIAALAGQGLALGEAAALGAYLHARAGDAAAAAGGQRGLLPSDLISFLRAQVNPS